MKQPRVVLAAFVAGLTACGPTGPQKYEQVQTTTSTTTGTEATTQVAVTPTGTIYVRVLDGSTYGGLSGADVKVIGATSSGQTDADGVYKLEGAVVGSTYTFIVDKTGYTRLRIAAALPTTTGTSPLANPITTSTSFAYRTEGEVRGNVFFPNGRPVTGALVVVDPTNALGSGTYEAMPLTATTLADGSFKITGVPSRPLGFNHTVLAMGFDANADGTPDFATVSSSVAFFDKTVTRVYLTYNNNQQRVINSNIIDGELASGENPTFTFAVPVLALNLNQAAANAFALTNTTRNSLSIPVEATWAGSTQVTVKPAAGALRDGDRYSLTINLTTQEGASGTGPNFSVTYGFQVRPSAATAFTEQATNFSVASASPPATGTPADYDYNSTTFRLQWDGTAKAISYFIFAKDTGVNTTWVQLAGPISQVGLGTQRYVYSFSNFNSFPSFCPACSGTIWPLGYGNRVTFTVVGMDTYGNLAPLSGAPTQGVTDNWAPRANSVTLLAPTVVDAWNETSAATTILLQLTYNEPMDPASRPSFTFPTGVATSFVWDSFVGSYTGTLTLTVPPNTDGTGLWAIRGGKDMAGNSLTFNEFNGSLGGKRELLNNGSFEDSSGCQLSGWTATQTNTMPAPTAALGNAKLGSCAATIGTPLNGTAATGYARLTQDIQIPTLPVGSPMYFTARLKASFSFAPAMTGVGSLAQLCRFTDSTNNPTLATFFSQGNVNSPVGSSFEYTANSGLAPGTTVRLLCEVNNATTNAVNGTIYLDDVSVAQVKPATGGQYPFGP